MSGRDADITKFTFASYRTLKKTLGEFDAVVECNELAIREFVENIHRHGEEFIQAQSRQHEIRVSSITKNGVIRRTGSGLDLYLTITVTVH